MTHLISATCVNDARCVPVCPVDAIHPRPDEPGFLSAEMLFIDPIACIDCGACLRACPIGAIRTDDDPRPDTPTMLDLNAAYFVEPPVVPAAEPAGGWNG